MCGVEMDSVTASAVHHVTAPAPASACSWGTSGYPPTHPFNQSYPHGVQGEPWSAVSATMSSSSVQASTTTEDTTGQANTNIGSDAESWPPGFHTSPPAKSPFAGDGQDSWCSADSATTKDDDSCNDDNVLKGCKPRIGRKGTPDPETPPGREIDLSMSSDSSPSEGDRYNITPDTPHSRSNTDPYFGEPSDNDSGPFNSIPNANPFGKSYESSPTPSIIESARLARVAGKLQDVVDELRDMAGMSQRRQHRRSLRSPSPLSSTSAAPSLAATEPVEYIRLVQRREEEKPARPAWRLRKYLSGLHDSLRGATLALHRTNTLSRTKSQKRKTYSREEDGCDGQTDKRFRRM